MMFLNQYIVQCQVANQSTKRDVNIIVCALFHGTILMTDQEGVRYKKTLIFCVLGFPWQDSYERPHSVKIDVNLQGTEHVISNIKVLSTTETFSTIM
jgi:hypothetical protein